MICPKCACSQPDSNSVCDRCGVIFARLAARPRPVPTVTAGGESASAADSECGTLRELLFRVAPEPFRPFVAGRAVVYLLMLFWGVRFIFASIASGLGSETVLHLIHLPFHEAGHVIFGLAGIRFLTVLGGTLGQLLIPAAVIGSFLLRRDQFGASVGGWWLGQSCMDVAIYANDARAGQLMLIGGVTGSEVEDYHDWEVMLGRLGWLQYDHVIAGLFYGAGTILILASLAWGGYILWQQSRRGTAAEQF